MDQFGAVAAFVTAGKGEIPSALLTGAAVDLRDLEALVMVLPVVGDATLHVSVPRPDGFLDMAYGGLYVYGWNHGRYALVVAPNTALEYAELNEHLKAIARFAIFKSPGFSKHAVVSVGSLAEVIRPGL